MQQYTSRARTGLSPSSPSAIPASPCGPNGKEEGSGARARRADGSGEVRGVALWAARKGGLGRRAGACVYMVQSSFPSPVMHVVFHKGPRTVMKLVKTPWRTSSRLDAEDPSNRGCNSGPRDPTWLCVPWVSVMLFTRGAGDTRK